MAKSKSNYYTNMNNKLIPAIYDSKEKGICSDELAKLYLEILNTFINSDIMKKYPYDICEDFASKYSYLIISKWNLLNPTKDPCRYLFKMLYSRFTIYIRDECTKHHNVIMKAVHSNNPNYII